MESGNGIKFEPETNRLSVEYTASAYQFPGSAVFLGKGKVKIYKIYNSFWNHLKGVKAGDKIQLYLTPQIALSPHYGMQEHFQENYDLNNKPMLYEISVKDVCKPIFLTLWREFGIFGSMIIEVGCSD